MGERILKTLIWCLVLFILFALYYNLKGVEDWIIDTLDWIVPAGVGFFSGLLVERSK